MKRPLEAYDIRLYRHDHAWKIDRQAWEYLADHSVTPNPFYERWSLIPALKHLRDDRRIVVVTIYFGQRLVALFPVHVIQPLPSAKFLSIWNYKDCHLTDILRVGQLPVLALLRKTMKKLGALSITSPHHSPPGFPLGHKYRLHKLRQERKIISSETTFESWQSHLPRKARNENRRIVNRALQKEGLVFRESAPDDDENQWLQRYIDVENNSWKAEDGNPIAASDARRCYFTDAIRLGSPLGKIEFHGLFDNQQAAAMAIRFKTQNHVYEVKTSYRDEYRKIYPGAVLEILTIEDILNRKFTLADSCSYRNDLVDRLWPESIPYYRSLVFRHSFVSGIARRAYRLWVKLQLQPTQSS